MPAQATNKIYSLTELGMKAKLARFPSAFSVMVKSKVFFLTIASPIPPFSEGW